MIKKMGTGLIIFIIGAVIFGGCSGGRSDQSNSGDYDISEFTDDETVPPSAEDLFAQALEDSVIEEEYLTPAGELTNAILYSTQIDVLEDNGSQCEVKIGYPDVGTMLSELAENLPDNFDEKEAENVYRQLTQAVENGEVSMLEGTFVLDILSDEDGEYYIDWTEEAMNAMTGGLSAVE